MKKTGTIILASLAALFLIAVATFAGWRVADNYRTQETIGNETPNTETAEQATVYFYRTDGIYRVTSENSEPEKIVETTFNQEKGYYFSPKFEIMGTDHNWLVYRDMTKIDELEQVQFALVVYDLENKKELLTVAEDLGSVISFTVSPSGKSLAYVVNKHDPDKKISDGPEPFFQELYFWDGAGEAEKILTEESGFFSIVLGNWLDDENFTAGRGYEGVSFCKINVTTTKKFPEDCTGYGESTMGTTDNVEAIIDGVAYGFHYECPEIVGNRRTNNGIFEQTENGERRFITSDVPSDLTVDKDNIYYLRNSRDGSKYTWNGSESDLYLVSKNGETLKRLTNDGTSIAAKSQLSLSNDGRFLTYQVTDLSQLSPDKNTVEEQSDNSKIWLYDLKLNKYYVVAEKGLAPRVVIK